MSICDHLELSLPLFGIGAKSTMISIHQTESLLVFELKGIQSINS
jgi:hypothetical protein